MKILLLKSTIIISGKFTKFPPPNVKFTEKIYKPTCVCVCVYCVCVCDGFSIYPASLWT